MASTINGTSTGSGGLISTGDDSGILNIQTNETTAITIDASQAVTMAGRTTNPTTISVGAATPSTSGAGITFPAAQSASSNANTLDDYEEGTFSPTLTCGGGSVTILAGYTDLAYTKTGRVVTVTGQVTIGAISAPTGTLTVGNLPFVMANIGVPGQCRPSIPFYGNGAGAPSSSYFSGLIAFVTNTTSGVIIATYNATYDDTIANWMGVGSDIFINFSYFTNT